MLTSSRDRICADCGSRPADFAIVDDAGTFSGWLCDECDRKRRRRRLGWRRRIKHRFRHRFLD
jgi:hypothetical protein